MSASVRDRTDGRTGSHGSIPALGLTVALVRIAWRAKHGSRYGAEPCPTSGSGVGAVSLNY